jgi:NAD(P)-dependent dehydrogenase (short-subunit alcohol dehydrogenase family)
MKTLEGKVAVVTGGSTGIGLATAQLFAEEGAFVFITGRRENELQGAVKQIGNQVTAVRGDVSNFADLDRLYDSVKREKGRIDILFANAGISGAHGQIGEITEKDFDQMFDINVKGLLFSVQKALPLFVDGGSIILNASVVASKVFPGLSVYTATKAAVLSFARNWSIELKSRGIRVNAISPGPIDTPIFKRDGRSEEEDRQMRAGIAATVPLGRMGAPDEIAKAALFLASRQSSFVTGTELLVDGGVGRT